MDRTIPRHAPPSGFASHPTYGEFVDYGDRIILWDFKNCWELDYVSILSGSFGGREEGIQKFPRPSKYDPTGITLVQGDRVVIDFPNGNTKCPVVRGGVRSVNPSDFFQYLPGAAADANRLRARIRPLDEAGAPAGRVDFKVADDGTGTVFLGATHGIVLDVASDLDTGIPMRIAIGLEEITITKGGAAQRVVLGDTFISDLNNLMIALAAFFTTTSGAATAAIIAGAAALLVSPPGPPTAPVTVFLAALQQSLSGGAPHLSNRTKTE